ncbi:MAG TPA: lysophospholipid acyltransferase family protein [Longilinea sp.]|nr:lysophospholipid acyltransferase family protein [Longilinea sp.]
MNQQPAPETSIKYPRRVFTRKMLKYGIRTAAALLFNLKITGKENLPKGGPLIVIANHFNWADPTLMIAGLPWTTEFIGGARMPWAPQYLTFLVEMYRTLPVYRGTVSRQSLVLAESVLKQNGVLGIFPEGGSWADILRPPRPGTALLAVRTKARILPVGLNNVAEIFPAFKNGKRATVEMRFGPVFGPYDLTPEKMRDRDTLDELGHDMMRHVADLLPPEKRGWYSNDPALHAAGVEAARYPFADNPDLAQ